MIDKVNCNLFFLCYNRFNLKKIREMVERVQAQIDSDIANEMKKGNHEENKEELDAIRAKAE